MTDIYRLENLRDGLAIDVYRNLPLMIEEKGNLLTSLPQAILLIIRQIKYTVFHIL